MKRKMLCALLAGLLLCGGLLGGCAGDTGEESSLTYVEEEQAENDGSPAQLVLGTAEAVSYTHLPEQIIPPQGIQDKQGRDLSLIHIFHKGLGFPGGKVGLGVPCVGFHMDDAIAALGLEQRLIPVSYTHLSYQRQEEQTT